jgi:nitrogen-specific signal transduction histidine kinase
VQVNEIVTETLEMLSGSLGAGVAIETSLDPDLPLILADGGGVQQILMNFCVNASDAMDAVGRLRVSTTRESGFVRVDVEHRPRHSGSHPFAHLRALLHDQERARYGPRPSVVMARQELAGP